MKAKRRSDSRSPEKREERRSVFKRRRHCQTKISSLSILLKRAGSAQNIDRQAGAESAAIENGTCGDTAAGLNVIVNGTKASASHALRFGLSRPSRPLKQKDKAFDPRSIFSKEEPEIDSKKRRERKGWQRRYKTQRPLKL